MTTDSIIDYSKVMLGLNATMFTATITVIAFLPVLSAMLTSRGITPIEGSIEKLQLKRTMIVLIVAMIVFLLSLCMGLVTTARAEQSLLVIQIVTFLFGSIALTYGGIDFALRAIKYTT